MYVRARRHASHRDDNEPEIVEALLMVGASVDLLDDEGIPDLLVGYQARTYLLEVKAPLGPKGGESRSALTPAQVEWRKRWRGEPARTVHNIPEALAAIRCGHNAERVEATVRARRAAKALFRS